MEASKSGDPDPRRSWLRRLNYGIGVVLALHFSLWLVPASSIEPIGYFLTDGLNMKSGFATIPRNRGTFMGVVVRVPAIYFIASNESYQRVADLRRDFLQAEKSDVTTVAPLGRFDAKTIAPESFSFYLADGKTVTGQRWAPWSAKGNIGECISSSTRVFEPGGISISLLVSADSGWTERYIERWLKYAWHWYRATFTRRLFEKCEIAIAAVAGDSKPIAISIGKSSAVPVVDKQLDNPQGVIYKLKVRREDRLCGNELMRKLAQSHGFHWNYEWSRQSGGEWNYVDFLSAGDARSTKDKLQVGGCANAELEEKYPEGMAPPKVDR